MAARVERWSVRRAVAVITVSQGLQSWLLRSFGVSATVLYDTAPAFFSPLSAREVRRAASRRSVRLHSSVGSALGDGSAARGRPCWRHAGTRRVDAATGRSEDASQSRRRLPVGLLVSERDADYADPQRTGRRLCRMATAAARSTHRVEHVLEQRRGLSSAPASLVPETLSSAGV